MISSPSSITPKGTCALRRCMPWASWGRRPSRGLLADLFPTPHEEDDCVEDKASRQTSGCYSEPAYEGLGAAMVEGP